MLVRSLTSSVADPFHLDTAPDPGIRFMETWIWIWILLRIRPKIEKISTFFIHFFSSDYQQNYLLLNKY